MEVQDSEGQSLSEVAEGKSIRQIAARVAYDGTDYFGFQVQSGAPTIQGLLERSLGTFTTLHGRISAAGRTDRGVHARGQVIGLSLDWRHSLEALQRAWNAHLPPEIAIDGILEAPEGFHPRFSANSRIYRYTVMQRVGTDWDARSPLARRYAAVQSRMLDLAAMQQAASLLLGEHDFATFGTPTVGESTTRTVLQAIWQQAEPPLPPIAGQNEDLALVFTIEANAFLKHMVRKLVGSMIKVGRGAWSVEQFASALAVADGSQSAPPAPPNGLVFEAATYPSRWGIVW
jgi:tRNA pseudouridine38-40 synthase